jgi:bifunctional UDP-N-acetylglucosamine pyrophosphorylase/glucosamine-1-phosphate N-acetyltransferase
MVKKRPAPAAPSPLSVIILAAGEGKRMKSALPKVLQPLAGRPLLQHVIATARTLAPAAIYVVYGHGDERVREALKDEAVTWVLQRERLGTGHAVLQALLPGFGARIYGVPLPLVSIAGTRAPRLRLLR